MLNSSVPKNEFDINTLVNHYGDNLLRLCFLYLHDYHSAEDAVQEAFIKAYRNINTFFCKKSCIPACRNYSDFFNCDHCLRLSKSDCE